jgi:hypothetical protein
MPNYNQSARRVLGDIGFGLRVERAAADLPATTSDDLFTIYNGKVQLYIVGEVTTVIETQANNTNLEFLPTAATGARNDLCAVLDITADVVGTQYTIDGTAGNAMIDSGTTGWHIKRTPLILAPGTIELHCAATNTGQVKWTVWYVPLEGGAYVAAV